MTKIYSIFSGLGGGFNSLSFTEKFEGSYEDAMRLAEQKAIEEYESYVGLHGLRTVDDIMEEDDVDQEIAEEIYNEEMQSWIDFYVKEYEEGDEEK